MGKSIAIGGSWTAEKTIDLGAGTAVDARIGSMFKKVTTTNVAIAINNLTEGRSVTVVIKNDAASTITVSLPAVQNSADLVTNIPAGKYAIYKVILAYGSLLALTPIRTESYFA